MSLVSLYSFVFIMLQSLPANIHQISYVHITCLVSAQNIHNLHKVRCLNTYTSQQQWCWTATCSYCLLLIICSITIVTISYLGLVYFIFQYLMTFGGTQFKKVFCPIRGRMTYIGRLFNFHLNVSILKTLFTCIICIIYEYMIICDVSFCQKRMETSTPIMHLAHCHPRPLSTQLSMRQSAYKNAEIRSVILTKLGTGNMQIVYLYYWHF